MTLTRGASIDLDVMTGTVRFTEEPIRSTITESANGDVKGSESANRRGIITIAVRLKPSEQAAFNLFLRGTLNYRVNTASLDPGSGVDIGAGLGTARTVRFWSPNGQIQQSQAMVLTSMTFRVEN